MAQYAIGKPRKRKCAKRCSSSKVESPIGSSTGNGRPFQGQPGANGGPNCSGNHPEEASLDQGLLFLA